jgi:serine/threonine protein kinase
VADIVISINKIEARKLLVKLAPELPYLKYLHTGFTSHVFKSSMCNANVVLKVPKANNYSYKMACEYFNLVKKLKHCPQYYRLFQIDGVEIMMEEFFDAPSLNLLPKKYSLTNGIFRDLGLSIAQLHSESNQRDGSYFPKKINADINKYCSEELTHKFFGSILSKSIQDCLSFKPAIQDIVVCHGDLHSENIFLKENNFIFIDPDPKIESSHWELARLLSSFVGCRERATIFAQVIAGYCDLRAVCPDTLSLFYAAILVKKSIKNIHQRPLKAKLLLEEIQRVLKQGVLA